MTNASRLLLSGFLLLSAVLGAAPDAAARAGDRETLRVPARRAQLVEDLLRETAAVDREAAAVEAGLRREAEERAALEAARRRAAEQRSAALAAAERREAELRAAAAAARRARDAESARATRPAPRAAGHGPTAAPPAADDPAEGGSALDDRPDGAIDGLEGRGVPSDLEHGLPPLPAPDADADAATAGGAAAAADGAGAPDPGAPDPAAPDPAAKAGRPGAAGGAAALGDEVRIAVVGGALLLAALWLIRRRRRARRGLRAVPAQLRTLGKVSLGNRWQVTLLELPDEVLVLGAGENGVQVLTRITDPARVAALRQAQEDGGRGFGRLLKGILDRPADALSSAAAAAAAGGPAFAVADTGSRRMDGVGPGALDDGLAPADILAAERAFELHRALHGGLAGRGEPEGGRPTRPSAQETRELLEIELMKQRLADLRAGRFAQ
jgi:flagellar biogenesis protein FliO